MTVNRLILGDNLEILKTLEAERVDLIYLDPPFVGIKFFDTPLISESIAVNVLAGITGSASGGMSIALEAMGAEYLKWANDVGLNPELLHRVAAMSSGGFDTMPPNGAVITLLAICGMTHKKSYPDLGMVSLVVPFMTTLVLIVIWTILGLQF